MICIGGLYNKISMFIADLNVSSVITLILIMEPIVV